MGLFFVVCQGKIDEEFISEAYRFYFSQSLNTKIPNRNCLAMDG
ncbi:hypothetical protein SDC9_165580 [bioreactor metagenome]|uniref:Uncharacterized protein n=1 Tax=bioreactor metagenome TaxID=1076179 RepID=A0A645FUP3_9ZZZZ